MWATFFDALLSVVMTSLLLMFAVFYIIVGKTLWEGAIAFTFIFLFVVSLDDCISYVAKFRMKWRQRKNKLFP